MDKKYWIFAIMTLVIISGCTESDITGKTVYNAEKPLTIGIQNSPANALIMVAKDKGFFQQEGLNVELVEFTGGKYALQAFLSGSIDMAVSGEVPVTFSSMQGNEFYVITQVVERTTNEVRVVAIKEPDLDTPHEYFNAKRRKLATSVGGGPEFYIYNFMKKYNITDAELVNLKPEDMPVALESGSVDAIAIFDPHAYFAEQKLGSKAVTFWDETMYSELYVLSADRDWVNQNPEIIERIIRSLVKASEFMKENPAESKAIVANYTKLDKKTLDGIWGNFEFKPALNNLLLEYWNLEAEWAKETGKVKNEAQIPDFKAYIYKDALLKVKPEAVTI
ncbi:MAG: ABC transporter substrate-binding protein [Candidatus Altiarchaeales archaeon]|nr:ABC transporter substrate-binding protein [Candidatus Altiarchaeales archaeon]